MDILTHTLSGFAVGTVVASFSTRGFKEKVILFLVSGLAGALPDLDAISLWSHFDSTIGRFFKLSHSGQEIYYAKFWYSHHAFLHSLFAGIFMAIILGIAIYFINTGFRSVTFSKIMESIRKNRLVLIGSMGGFLVHLLEDMPTPSSVWGGVNFFWPSRAYNGGSGDIWWWNNYDIFLIVLGLISINLLLHLSRKVIAFNLKRFTVGVFITAFALTLFQIKTRDFDFAYTGHTVNYPDYELKSKELQREILGDKLFEKMEKFDKSLGIYF